MRARQKEEILAFPCHRGSQVLHIWNSCKQSRGSRTATAESSRGQWEPPASQQPCGGNGGNKCRTTTWSPDAGGSSTPTHCLSREGPRHARAPSLLGERRQELATDTLPAAPASHEQPQPHSPCPRAPSSSQIPPGNHTKFRR